MSSKIKTESKMEDMDCCNNVDNMDILEVMLLPNDEAPDFNLMSVNSETIEEVSLSSFKGKKVLLVFFPIAMGVVTPSEFYQLDHLLDEFRNLNYAVIGISTDPIESLNLWMEEKRAGGGLQGMDIILASDPSGDVGKKYNILKDEENKNFKAAVLVDEDGKIILTQKSDFPVGISFEYILDTMKTA